MVNVNQTDIFIPARLGSKRLPKKHLKEVNGIPMIKHLLNRLESCKLINKIIVCTTNEYEDDELVDYLKNENVITYRGSEKDILERFLKAAEIFNTEIIIDVEADKIYTDPKYVDLISSKLQNNEIDFMTGNNSEKIFDPEFAFHGFMPAGIRVNALKKICELKKTNNTETGYKEYFTSNEFINKKYLFPEPNIKIPNEFRFSLDYLEDLKLAEKIFSELGTKFDTEKLLEFINNNKDLQKIIQPIMKKWKKDYDLETSEFRLDY